MIEQNRQVKEPLVSVIIPTYDSAKTLPLCLKSIDNQTYKNIETIIVDKDSTDNTLAIAMAFPVRVFSLKARERSQQVNFGVGQANGKYIYRVDSDFIVEPNVVEQAVCSCEMMGYDAVCVHNSSDATVSFWAKVRKFERDMYKGDPLNSAARFVKRKAFETVGGFDEKLIAAEDYDLHNRLIRQGFKVGTIKAQEIHLGEPKTLRDVVSKHYYYGKTLRSFARKDPQKAMKQLSPLRLAFTRNSSEFIRHPFIALAFLFYQFVRYVSAGLGFLIDNVES